MKRMPTTLLRAVVFWPSALVSFVLWCVVLALLPPLLSTLMFGVGVAVVIVLAAGQLEVQALAILVRARRATAGERRVMAEAVEGLRRIGIDERELLVRRHQQAPAPTVAAVGRGTLVVSLELVGAASCRWMSTEEVVALVAHEVAAHQAQRPRAEVAAMAVLTPWRMVVVMFGGIGTAFAWMPLGQIAWMMRGVIGLICVVQSAAQGRTVAGLLGAAMIGLTYVVPAAERTLRQRTRLAGDDFVIDRGLGPVLAGLLTRCCYAATTERLRYLRQPRPAATRPWSAAVMPMAPISLN